uniref:Sortilin related VPS10 domain containing receptor 1 n=1 Tax=Amphiprion percula TaxID=161767 RepID=A0A3P8SIB2_AMPPE
MIFSEWIWLLTTTSILGGTKAEVRCIPSCQLPLIAAFPQELSALDLSNFGDAPAEEFVGFTEVSPRAGLDEKHSVAELTASEESSHKVQPRSGENDTNCLQKDAVNRHQKLSHPEVFSQSVSDPSSSNRTENGTGDGNDVALNEDGNVASWRRTRGARSAETWSGFRPEGGEDASVSDQEEFQLTSSTFALTEDTAHNQAMVHWSGQNSSVNFRRLFVCVFVVFLALISCLPTGSQYITCKLQNCSDGNKGKPFPGFIIPNSLVVQDEYVFIQVPVGGQSVHYVSYKRNAFYPMKLPKYTLPKDLQIISTDDNQVVAAIQDWHQNDSYNLYMSESRGLFFTLMLEEVVSSGGPEGNIMIDLYEVAGIKGVFLSNKVVENQVRTYITYNKGRDWRLLQAPTTDLQGNKVYCEQPYCSLHLHLHVSENPYTSGNIVSKDSAPGIIIASGVVGPELTNTNVSVFITSDAGNTWREVFQEEYSVFFLNQGGSLVAIRHTPLPIRHIWLSFDEGRNWDKYSFTSSPLYVDGVLGEPGEDTLIMTIFGHFSHRSEWQLVKIDFRSIFRQRCTPEDYLTWQLHNEGEVCIMGMKRIFQNLKANVRCVKARDQYISQISDSCPCTEADFECDYGFERQTDGSCTPAFWFVPSATSRDCITGDKYGHLHTLHCQGDITVDFGDGTAISYVNISSIDDGVKHIYSKVGIYQVSATASNNLGLDRVILYLHVTCQLEQVQLSAPSVVVKNKAVNLTTVLRPSNVGTVTYYWWFDNKTEPVVTLDGAVSFTFSKEGSHTVTVQASVGNTVHQDQMRVAVYDYFRSHVLAFSSNLDELNPGVSEWREDIGRVVKSCMVTGISEDQLLVTVLPGSPTTAEIFIVPERRARDRATDEKWAHLDQVLPHQIILMVSGRCSVQCAPLVDSSDSGHSGTAVIMLVSVVLMGLAVFVIYKFKRKIPGMNTYTAEQPDKEQEVIPTVTSIAVPNPEGDKLTSLEHVDVQLDSKSRGICVCFYLQLSGFARIYTF